MGAPRVSALRSPDDVYPGRVWRSWVVVFVMVIALFAVLDTIEHRSPRSSTARRSPIRTRTESVVVAC